MLLFIQMIYNYILYTTTDRKRQTFFYPPSSGNQSTGYIFHHLKKQVHYKK
jgi:hypothetical protein